MYNPEKPSELRKDEAVQIEEKITYLRKQKERLEKELSISESPRTHKERMRKVRLEDELERVGARLEQLIQKSGKR